MLRHVFALFVVLRLPSTVRGEASCQLGSTFSSLLHGRVISHMSHYTVTCAPGYRMPGNDTSRSYSCSSEVWRDYNPDTQTAGDPSQDFDDTGRYRLACTAIQCPVINGREAKFRMSTAAHEYQTTLRLDCHHGYQITNETHIDDLRLETHLTLKCGLQGRWSVFAMSERHTIRVGDEIESLNNAKLRCQPVECNLEWTLYPEMKVKLLPQDNGSPKSCQLAEYSCKDSYSVYDISKKIFPIEKHYARCQRDEKNKRGVWTPENQYERCKETSCPLTSLSDTLLIIDVSVKEITNDDAIQAGDRVVVKCKSSHQRFEGTPLRDQHMLLCNLNGTWNNTKLPQCIDIYCPSVKIPNLKQDSVTATANRPIATLVRLECIEDFVFHPSQSPVLTIKCLASGNWDYGNYQCQRYRCPNLTLENGFVEFPYSRLEGAIAKAGCDSGYRFEGQVTKADLILRCIYDTRDGVRWSQSLPRCESGPLSLALLLAIVILSILILLIAILIFCIWKKMEYDKAVALQEIFGDVSEEVVNERHLSTKPTTFAAETRDKATLTESTKTLEESVEKSEPQENDNDDGPRVLYQLVEEETGDEDLQRQSVLPISEDEDASGIRHLTSKSVPVGSHSKHKKLYPQSVRYHMPISQRHTFSDGGAIVTLRDMMATPALSRPITATGDRINTSDADILLQLYNRPGQSVADITVTENADPDKETTEESSSMANNQQKTSSMAHTLTSRRSKEQENSRKDSRDAGTQNEYEVKPQRVGRKRQKDI